MLVNFLRTTVSVNGQQYYSIYFIVFIIVFILLTIGQIDEKLFNTDMFNDKFDN